MNGGGGNLHLSVLAGLQPDAIGLVGDLVRKGEHKTVNYLKESDRSKSKLNILPRAKEFMIRILLIVIVTLLMGSFAWGSKTVMDEPQLRLASSSGTKNERQPEKNTNDNKLSLCGTDESVVLSCAIRGSRKLLSICSSRQLDAERGDLQYRFGVPGRIELEFPNQRSNSQAAFWFIRYTRPQVTYLTLRFKTSDYLYSVHENSVYDIKPGVEEVTVTALPLKTSESGPQQIEQRCRRPVKGSLLSLEEVVPNKSWSSEEMAYP